MATLNLSKTDDTDVAKREEIRWEKKLEWIQNMIAIVEAKDIVFFSLQNPDYYAIKKSRRWLCLKLLQSSYSDKNEYTN